MKALPLWQPWASLVAIESKRVETRSWPVWPSLIGQRVAIHATKTRAHLLLASREPFHGHLRRALDDGRLILDRGELPLGALIATCVIDRCTPVTTSSAHYLQATNPDEHAFGLYDLADGPRYAWVLRDVHRLERPVPFKGSQGIFDVPDQLLGLAPAQGALL